MNSISPLSNHRTTTSSSSDLSRRKPKKKSPPPPPPSLEKWRSEKHPQSVSHCWRMGSEQKLVKDGFIIRKPTKFHSPEEILRLCDFALIVNKVARASAFSVGLLYGSMKLKVLKKFSLACFNIMYSCCKRFTLAVCSSLLVMFAFVCNVIHFLKTSFIMLALVFCWFVIMN
ncbi:BnaA02g09630D [Brassica napus]|uniref:BnaA02g09630D protein n=1 Tax=Brassica napus TaxID=3708 RepID=A0A078GTE5_BRANA|nr:BnaA02g09630D [Brassica napus]